VLKLACTFDYISTTAEECTILKTLRLILIILLLSNCKSNKGQKPPSKDPQAPVATSNDQAKKASPSKNIDRMSCVTSDTGCKEFLSYSENTLKEKGNDCKGEWSSKACPTENLLGSCRSSSKFSSQSTVVFYYFTKNTAEHERFQKANSIALSCSPPKIFTRVE